MSATRSLTLNDRYALALRAGVSQAQLPAALEKRDVSIADTDGLRALGALGGFGGITGISVNETSALGLSSVWRCVVVRSEAVAQLPLGVFEKLPNGGRRPASEHPVDRLLSLQPNAYQTSFVFRQYLQACADLWGNGYAWIERNARFRPVALHPLHPSGVEVIDNRRTDGRIWYRFTDAQGKQRTLPAYDMIHIVGITTNGLTGRSVLSVARQSLSTQLANQRYGADFYQAGGALQYALLHPKTLSKTAHANLSDDFGQQYTGVGGKRHIVLEEGMTLEAIGLPPEDAKFLETAKMGVLDICRLFGVPPHKVFELDRATFSNIEAQGIEFVQTSLGASLIRYEQEYRIKLFRESEIPTYYTRHNVTALMRGDAAARGEYYNKMRQSGLMTANEIRELEDLPPVEGGDVLLVNGNMISAQTAAEQKPGAPTTQPPPA